MNGLLALIRTGDSIVPFVLRLGLGVVIVPHGLQKTFGWFGGFGFVGTMDFFTQGMGIPWVLGLAAILAESAGAILLLLGALTRPAALAIGTTMSVAMLTTHVQHGFFMNWFGEQSGEGVEFFVLAIALAAGLTMSGGGRLSVDRALARALTDA